MFQSGVQEATRFGDDLRPLASGDILPLAPGAVDRVRLGWLREALIADPALIEVPACEAEAEGSSASAVDGDTAAGVAESGGGADKEEDAADEAWRVAAEAHPASRVPRYFPPGVEDVPGGAVLAELLTEVEIPDLGAYELVEYIAAAERVAAAVHAWQSSAIAELVRRQRLAPTDTGRPVTTPERHAALEVAARLTLSRADGDALVARAQYMASVLPDTWSAWAVGLIDTPKADVIGRRLARLDDGLARRVEARVLPQAPKLTVESLRRLINRVVNELDPKDAQERHREARKRRGVWITPLDDGMAWLEAYLSAEDAAAVMAILDAGAATLKHSDVAGDGSIGDDSAGGRQGDDRQGDDRQGDDRQGDDRQGDRDGRPSVGNRRADVLAALAWAALAAGRIGGCPRCGCASCERGVTLARVHGRPVSVHLTVPASSILGIDDRPGELAGMGPVTAEVARELATRGAVWHRVLTDPVSGTVLDVGRTRYRPPVDLAEHVLIRDLTCVWPGCDQPATAAGVELDHQRAWADGGHTADYNLGPFCERHHGDKHEAGWEVIQVSAGRFQFRSPSGHTYVREPAGVGPIVESPARDGTVPARDGAVADSDPPQ